MVVWRKLSEQDIQERVFSALKLNIDYQNSPVLGIPASNLDEKVFNPDVDFIKNAPFISTLVNNPNHIGCHTFGDSESYFKGTQQIERELIELCAVDILKAEKNSCDGYVASGGTEANIQAMWMYRNFFKTQYSCKNEAIAVLCSEDSHYSMDKGANILQIPLFKIAVDQNTRKIDTQQLQSTLEKASEQGVRHLIIICNMMTTMFGSVDQVSDYLDVISTTDMTYKIHVDGAFGGFYYPFTNKESKLNFQNEHISSFTLDAHKMAQAPYGTGIFLVRKGLIQYTQTNSASYVEGEDCTLIGSRSGANAVSIWIILMKHGPYGWIENIFILQKRTQWLCEQLTDLNIAFYRNEFSNIVTIKSDYISPSIAKEFGLVPDNHQQPKWYKIVVMRHVTIEILLLFISKIGKI